MLVLPPQGATLRLVAQAVRQLTEGRNNAVKLVTLTPGSATTVVQDQFIVTGGAPFFTAATASAAAELGTMYVGTADIIPGQFTINHTNSATADRTFHYIFLGG